MTLFAFVAGMSFVIACVALVIAIAEHRRAERVEKLLIEGQHDANQAHSRLLTAVAGLSENQARAVSNLETVTNRLVDQERMIRAVAAASLPPVYPAGDKVQIVVPGPGTMQ
jgi:hypothetical protein